MIYHDPTAKPAYNAQPVDLDTLLRESDFVSIHVPLNAETKHLVNAEFLAKMKPNAVLVNTARGGVLDQNALYHALKSNQIFAAALDVTDPEPLPMDSPLLELENCLIVPHLGSASKKTRDMMSLLAAQNLVAGLERRTLAQLFQSAGVWSNVVLSAASVRTLVTVRRYRCALTIGCAKILLFYSL